MDVADLRRSYTRGGLAEGDLAADPVIQFDRWLREAVTAELLEPTAMVLGTVDPAGRPSARTVLLKRYDEQGFVFFTNYESRKGRDLIANPQASLLFPWYQLERQVVITGAVQPVDPALSTAYFQSRPRGSQLGAWASPQSTPVASREVLDQRLAEARRRFPDDVPVPRPPFWGGLRVVPDDVEFWQGRPDRLHDRLCYRRKLPGSTAGWVLQRLAP